MDPSTSRPAVVIDNGTGQLELIYTKMGFACNVEPCFITPTVVAVNESFITQSNRSSNKGSSSWMAQHSAGVMANLDYFIMEEALSKSRTSCTYNLSCPIKHGQVDNWDAMERFWQQCIFNYLCCDPEDHYILLTEGPLSPPKSREYTGEIMYETFNVPGFILHCSWYLLLLQGTPHLRCCSRCWRWGHSCCTCCRRLCYWEQYRVNTNFGERCYSLRPTTHERGEHVPPEDSLEIARKVKETYCYTCADIVKECNKHDKEPAKYIKQWRGIKPKTGRPYACDVGYERFLGPEIFFNPEIYNREFTTLYLL